MRVNVDGAGRRRFCFEMFGKVDLILRLIGVGIIIATF